MLLDYVVEKHVFNSHFSELKVSKSTETPETDNSYCCLTPTEIGSQASDAVTGPTEKAG